MAIIVSITVCYSNNLIQKRNIIIDKLEAIIDKNEEIVDEQKKILMNHAQLASKQQNVSSAPPANSCAINIEDGYNVNTKV